MLMPQIPANKPQRPLTFLGGRASLATNGADPYPVGALPSPGSVRLSEAAVGDRVVLVQCLGGRSLFQRLAAAGFTLDAPMTILSRRMSGSVVVALPHQDVGLGAEIACHMLVKPA